jgi:vitamin B12 transport system substrate-binding protein
VSPPCGPTWLPGAAEPLLPVLRALNVPIFYSDPHVLADIPDTIDKLGALFGTGSVAGPAAAALRDQLRKIEQRYQGRPPLRVFIQAGREPLYTLNRNSIVNDAVRVCGGVNVFADGAVTAPQVSLEAVLAARPDAVVAGVSGVESLRETAAAWNAVQLPAALSGHVYGMDADVLYRPGPRLIAATESLCEALEHARPPRR